MAEEKKDDWEKYMDGLTAEQEQEEQEGNQNETKLGDEEMSYGSPVFFDDFMAPMAQPQQAMQYAAYSQPKTVIEIEQKDLQSCLENLKQNSRILTEEQNYMYNCLMSLAGTDAVINKNKKLLVATNEQNQVVGIGSANFIDRKQSPEADLDFVLSVEKGAGRAIVNAIIDYSRQMENRSDLGVLPINEGLMSYYAQFGFVHFPGQFGMTRKKSGEFKPDIDVTTFQPLEATNQKIAEKRGRAMSR